MAVEGKEFDTAKLHVFLLSPVDLAVRKIDRFAEHDREDIAALARERLLSPEAFRERAEQALSHYVGNQDRVRSNLREAARIVESA